MKLLSGSIVQLLSNLVNGTTTDHNEDRSAFLRSDSDITWSGTQLSFTSDIVLDIINTYNGTSTTHKILAANSPISLADGESLWIEIDRTNVNETVTPKKTTINAIPAQTSSHKDLFVIGKARSDGSNRYLHTPLHKQIASPGDTFRYGSIAAKATGSLGDIVYSRLTEPQFQAQRDTTWVLYDGRDITGSALAALTGFNTLEDHRGSSPRVGNNGGGNPTAVTIAASPTGAVRFSNVVTITTTTNHGFVIGQQITIASVTNATFDGTFRVTSTPTLASFTYDQVAVNATSGTGTANVASRSDGNQNPSGNLALGTFQGDQVQDHIHMINSQNNVVYSGGPFTSPGGDQSAGAVFPTTNPTTGNHGAETRVKSLSFNAFIKIN